ncbi:uncharacterized protein E0L32_009530 [Thyridium curvatum]|uniref:Uncharacterized protein n=1 Tax=Thyridium curvatum TaxID=1093900 RepID=A0A507AVK1_9PEZI|nr:uncharacterized protein E0L32_009530 [Thyridium curvatum]TPX08951.1 hypothetical protein E0L32_009530 [Thyridium curvatum]
MDIPIPYHYKREKSIDPLSTQPAALMHRDFDLGDLSPGLALLGGQLGVVLLEPLAQAGGRGHGLLDAAGDAAGLAAGERLGGEVVDAGHEAVVDEVAEELKVIPPKH